MATAAYVEGDQELEHTVNRLTSLAMQEDKKPEESYQEVFKYHLYNKYNEFQNEFDLNSRKGKMFGLSEKYREEGALHYKNGRLEDALSCYNDSLAFLLGSKKAELARMYCDRGAVYFGLKLYKLCLEDLERSEYFGCPKNKLHELYYNFSCFYFASKKLNIAKDYALKGLDCLKELRKEVDPKTFKHLRDKFEQLKTSIECRRIKEQQGASLMESNESNAAAPDSLIASSVNFENRSIFCQERSNNIHREFADNVEVGHTKNIGYHLIAKEQINPGTTITTDNPFVAVLNYNKNNIIYGYYCSYCYRRVDIIMIPCDHCSEVRFCSNQCRIDAWKEFHYVECGYLEFLNEIDKTGYLCMRILLKEGVTKLAQMPMSELGEMEKPNPNLTNPVEFYNFFDNLPLINSSASEENRAAQGALKILSFLNRMYSRIFNVEHKSLRVEAVDPTVRLDKQPALNQKELEILGLRIVKRWLQIDLGLLKLPFNRVCSVDLGQRFAIECPAVSVFPLLNLFHHSCDPNVYYTRFEGGPVVFRAAHTIKEGEFLTVAKGVDIYRHARTRRVNYLRRICDCIACSRETYSCKSSEVRAFVRQLEEYYMGNQDKQDIKLLKLSLDLIKQEDLMCSNGNWLFWKLHRYIIQVLESLERNSYRHKSFRLDAECVNDVVTTILLSLQKIDFQNESLYAMSHLAKLLLDYTWHLSRFAGLEPSMLGLESFTGPMSLLCTFKDVYCANSISTHYEECFFSVLLLAIQLLSVCMG